VTPSNSPINIRSSIPAFVAWGQGGKIKSWLQNMGIYADLTSDGSIFLKSKWIDLKALYSKHWLPDNHGRMCEVS
jgi:hypothetical protein